MSDEFGGELPEAEGGPTWEQALHKLLDAKHVKYHTEMDAPDAMSTLDSVQALIDDEYGGGLSQVVRDFRKWKRDNWVAYKRKRAEEIVDGVKASAQAERASVTDKVLGTLAK